MDIAFYCDGPHCAPKANQVPGGVGVYLHGEAENEVGFDIPNTNIDLSQVESGLHPVKLNDQPGYTLVLWRSPNKEAPMLRGLVVKDTDASGLSHATERYNAQSAWL